MSGIQTNYKVVYYLSNLFSNQCVKVCMSNRYSFFGNFVKKTQFSFSSFSKLTIHRLRHFEVQNNKNVILLIQVCNKVDIVNKLSIIS
jgi:hypothetical protein